MSGVLRLCESEMTDGQDNERDPLQPDVDQTLVDQAIEELPYRTAAYERLMQKYQRMIFGVCYRMLNNRADAEDICQDVMVKVFGTLQKFEGRSSFKTWLMKITSNTCLTHITKNKRRREIRTEWAEDPARDGTTMIAYHAPVDLAQAHGLPVDHPSIQMMTGALAKLTGAAAAP